jgi:hypothetical protein
VISYRSLQLPLNYHHAISTLTWEGVFQQVQAGIQHPFTLFNTQDTTRISVLFLKLHDSFITKLAVKTWTWRPDLILDSSAFQKHHDGVQVELPRARKVFCIMSLIIKGASRPTKASGHPTMIGRHGDNGSSLAKDFYGQLAAISSCEPVEDERSYQLGQLLLTNRDLRMGPHPQLPSYSLLEFLNGEHKGVFVPSLTSRGQNFLLSFRRPLHN